ncbi:MAG TPA: arylsulfotransferase family protein [Thermoanaerobaculia bacterium]
MTGPSVSRPAAFFILAALLSLAGCGPGAEEGRVRSQAEISGERAITPSVETDPTQGKWRTARASAGAGSEIPADVKAIPYLQGYKEAQERPLVVEHEPEATYQGLNLYTSGHAAEAVLMDMSGQVLHRWRYPLRRLWKGLRKDPEAAKVEYWRRVYLYPNGDLLGIYEGNGLVKLNARSRVLWSQRGDIHHDLQVMDDGTIYVLDREGKILPRINPKEGVLEDFVTVLNPSGKVIRRLSILECFERSSYASLLRTMERKGDIFHTNTLEVLDGRFADRHPAFRKGNLLVSLWGIHVLAILDPEKRTVVWARTGGWRRQHQPTVLEDGRMLLFDNLGAARNRSRVIELDPLTGETLWGYGGTPEVDFFSKTLGSAQRLPNGNTLITESENGRALEVTRDGRTVWEFHNPHRAGERGELVAVLFEMVRLPPDFPFRGYNRDDA